MEATTKKSQSIYSIKQSYKYIADDSWTWWVWIDANDHELDEIIYVTYILHPSYSSPVKDVKDRESKFLLKAKGWGTFALKAKVYLKNGQNIMLTHELELEYPDLGIELLSEITVEITSNKAVIQLLHGDLTALPKKHAVDILVISAIRGDYKLVDDTLVKALHDKGIDVGDLAKDKEIDLVSQLDCWLSKPLSAEKQDELNFKRILCFEPSPEIDKKHTVVENIFRCINNFAFDLENKIIAMPVLATGSQKNLLENMLPAILDAAIFWLEKGLPLQFIKLVLHNNEQVKKALPVFLLSKQKYELKKSLQSGSVTNKEDLKLLNVETLPNEKSGNAMPLIESDIKALATKEGTETVVIPQQMETKENEQLLSTAVEQYDYFISYAVEQTDAVKIFVNALKDKDNTKKIFFDRDSFSIGGLWIKKIADTINNSKQFIFIMSPDYSGSKFCWDEFQCARLKEYNTKQTVIKPIYFFTDVNLPISMAIYSYFDCREGNLKKLIEAVNYL